MKKKIKIRNAGGNIGDETYPLTAVVFCGRDAEEMQQASVRPLATFVRATTWWRQTEKDSSVDALQPFIYQSQQSVIMVEVTRTQAHTLTQGLLWMNSCHWPQKVEQLVIQCHEPLL